MNVLFKVKRHLSQFCYFMHLRNILVDHDVIMKTNIRQLQRCCLSEQTGGILYACWGICRVDLHTKHRNELDLFTKLVRSNLGIVGRICSQNLKFVTVFSVEESIGGTVQRATKHYRKYDNKRY